LGLVAVADVHNGIITAIASVVVAAFTATLWFVTNKGLDLARDEFNASHRPQITVHHVEAIWGVIRNADGKKFKAVGAKVTYFNKGSVAATNVEIRGRIVTKNKQFSHLEGALMAPTIDCPNNVISGKTYSFEVQSQVTADAADGIEIDDPYGGVVQRSEIDVYCIGIIAYSDSSSVKRQTGFIWRWRTPFSWIRETNSPYHFEY
jgi:non-canonical (house-cleaning) NTP pyrophosphatase